MDINAKNFWPNVLSLETTAMFSQIKKSLHRFYPEYPKKKTFIPRLVLIGLVLSEENMFERSNVKNSKQVSKNGNNSQWPSFSEKNSFEKLLTMKTDAQCLQKLTAFWVRWAKIVDTFCIFSPKILNWFLFFPGFPVYWMHFSSEREKQQLRKW